MQTQTQKQNKDIIISMLYQNYLALSSTHQNNTQIITCRVPFDSVETGNDEAMKKLA